ncbi:hypothetical protein [Neobacillus dielmonensis]|uniref:hypothetical protein n=1 Tax=Neobacillus dielmonensis TaxID=1347369 RepID=UPI0005AA60D0|nr:hypothetical protein [Neobacillus dielmonensis]
MKIKVVMDSGKEYVMCENDYSVNDFTRPFFADLPDGSRSLNNNLVYLDGESKILVNPTRISSIEIIEK